MSYRIGMVSLGCAKNRVDAELMLSKLKEAGYALSEDPALADVAIVNTCGFIEDAKKESIDEILELISLKKEGKIKAIVVTGCLAERYREEVLKELPEADAVIGIGANADIAEVVGRALAGETTERFPEKEKLPLDGGRVQSTPFYTAYLKVADGCDNRCSYCAIPLIRGGFRSRRMEDVVAEAETLARNGVRELMVIAQDTTRYGEDLYGKLMLPELLRRLCTVDGLEWIRLLYCYPDRVTDELIDTVAREPKILPYIDLPLQHCNGRLLSAMNRRGDRESLMALIRKLRRRIPGVILRTTLIAGFPGETEEEFCELAEFVKEARFERLGCFPYSREEDTPAYDLPGQIDEETKLRRQEIIMETQARIVEEQCEEMHGRTIRVLYEGFDRYAECHYGRSAADSPDVDGKVFFTVKGHKPRPGDFVDVLVTDHMDCDLIGELAEK